MFYKRAVRIITHNNGYIGLVGPLAHSAPLFHETGLLNIYDIQISNFQVCVFLFKLYETTISWLLYSCIKSL